MPNVDLQKFRDSPSLLHSNKHAPSMLSSSTHGQTHYETSIIHGARDTYCELDSARYPVSYICENQAKGHEQIEEVFLD